MGPEGWAALASEEIIERQKWWQHSRRLYSMFLGMGVALLLISMTVTWRITHAYNHEALLWIAILTNALTYFIGLALMFLGWRAILAARRELIHLQDRLAHL